MKLRKTKWTLVAALALCATAAFAQDQKQDTSPTDPNAPLQPQDSNPSGGYANPPTGTVRGVSGPYDSQTNSPSQTVPDTNTLAGAQLFTVGTQAHNIFDPSLSFSLIGEDFPSNPGQSSLGATALLGGGLNFIHNWGHYRITTRYNGGETIETGVAVLVPGQNTSYFQFHDLTVIQEATWARWHVLLRDDFMASPGAAFTGAGMGGPGLLGQFSSTLGSSIAGIAQGFAPADTINTSYAMSYMNSVLGQADYSITRSSILTFSGSYGLLQYTAPGLISSTMFNTQAGYDYKLDPVNSIGLLASYGKIDYTGTVASTTDYSAGLAYGRKISGRLALQIEGGPQEIKSSGAGAAGNFQQLSPSINSALSYAGRRSGYTISYMHGLTAGSGVFMGAESDTFSVLGHYQITRYWTVSANAGYAYNKGLVPAGSPSVNFDDWILGANIGRLVGRHVQVNFNYGFIDQVNPSVCPVSSCGVAGFEHTFGMTVNWHLRPVGG